MIVNYTELNNRIKKGMISNCYIFCGKDEEIIKEEIKLISQKVVDKAFFDLNYIKLDGNSISMDTIINSCETMPVMSKKKMVVIYRAEFLEDSKNRAQRENNSSSDNNIFSKVSKYIQNLPPYCVLVIYYLFSNDREKISSKVKKLEKNACIVQIDKFKGISLEKKVKKLFEERNKEIGSVELKLFCSMVENDMNIIINEVEKLCSYTYEREISKDDILLLLPHKSDDDIFNLVDYISQRKPERAIEILDELIFKGEKIFAILSMIERQFKLLLTVKLEAESGASKEQISSKLNKHPYLCEKLMIQSRKFTVHQMKKNIDMCLDVEEKLKTTSAEEKTEIEFLIINTTVNI